LGSNVFPRHTCCVLALKLQDYQGMYHFFVGLFNRVSVPLSPPASSPLSCRVFQSFFSAPHSCLRTLRNLNAFSVLKRYAPDAKIFSSIDQRWINPPSSLDISHSFAHEKVDTIQDVNSLETILLLGLSTVFVYRANPPAKSFSSSLAISSFLFIVRTLSWPRPLHLTTLNQTVPYVLSVLVSSALLICRWCGGEKLPPSLPRILPPSPFHLLVKGSRQ